MSKMKFTLNPSGVSALLRSGEMQGLLTEKGQAVAERAGDGFELKVSPVKNVLMLR